MRLLAAKTIPMQIINIVVMILSSCYSISLPCACVFTCTDPQSK